MKRIAAMTLLLISAFFTASADDDLYPALSDPLDCRIQSLAIMSQRDGVFEGIQYNGGKLTLRGCLPVSMANSVIAALGVTDRETAIGMVKEAAQLLVFPTKRGEGRVELKFLPLFLNPEQRAQEAETYPYMARTVGRYPGEICLTDGTLSADIVMDHLKEMQTPCMLLGRMEVYPDWTEMIRVAQALGEAGLDDATILITHASAGTEASKAPLRSGVGGHYLTLLLDVKTFLEEGRVYVLDSLPRALKGEESGYTMVLRRPYPFWQEYTTFKKTFDAGRISPTVVRFCLTDRAAWQNASETEKSKMLAPMILFGPLVVMISCGEAQM